MNITPQQAAEIRKLTRRANRRIERAVQQSKGQGRYLESVVKRATHGSSRFSATTKGLTYEQAAAKLKTLDTFLGRISTTRVGWDVIKMEIVHKSVQTLSRKDYTITDDELAEILIQIDAEDKNAYYRAVNLVEVKKRELGDAWEGTSDQIANAIAEKISYQDALDMSIQARGGKK